MTQLMKYIYSHFNRFLPSVKIGVFFVFSVVCTTLLREVRLRFGNKNKNPQAFYFVLRSPCTNFAS